MQCIRLCGDIYQTLHKFMLGPTVFHLVERHRRGNITVLLFCEEHIDFIRTDVSMRNSKGCEGKANSTYKSL